SLRPGAHSGTYGGRGGGGTRRCRQDGAAATGPRGTTPDGAVGGAWSKVTTPPFDLNCRVSCHSSSRADSLTIDRQRRVWSDEQLFAYFAPEVTRDDGRECGMVFRNSFGTAGTWDDGGRGGVGERELQRGGLDGDPVALGEGRDARDLGKNLR